MVGLKVRKKNWKVDEFPTKYFLLKKFFSGPKLPAPCVFASPTMVTNPDGNGVTLVGCLEFDSTGYDKIYQLALDDNEELIWKILETKLKYPRSGRPVTMLVPDDFVNCV